MAFRSTEVPVESSSADASRSSPLFCRELGKTEVRFLLEYKEYNEMNMTFLVSSEIDLFAHQSLVREAIDEWRHMHPLLDCRVVKLDVASGDENEYAFVYASEVASDVKFLRLKRAAEEVLMEAKSDEINVGITQLLIEKEVQRPYRPLEPGQLLWRLIFYEFDGEHAKIHYISVCYLSKKNKLSY